MLSNEYGRRSVIRPRAPHGACDHRDWLSVASCNPQRLVEPAYSCAAYFFVRARPFVAPGPAGVSISSGRRLLVPFGTIAATTGFLSTLRRWRRGGFSLR